MPRSGGGLPERAGIRLRAPGVCRAASRFPEEVNEGHGWGNWRARMRDALPFVLGAPAPAR